MITGVHAIVFSSQAERVRRFFADVLGMPSADAGGGWLIFALPPAEVAFHPGTNGQHELYLMCEDLEATLAELRERGVQASGPIAEERWGRLASITLPGGSALSIYQPKHPIPPHR